MDSNTETRNCVLDAAAITRKIKRMALEIAEQNHEDKNLVVAAINGNGEIVARCLIQELQKIGGFEISYITIQLNKKDPGNVRIEKNSVPEQKAILLVDDVANSGRTMLYALKPLLEVHPKKIQTLVLVERSHKLFPVQTDYRGLSISTTLQEHITVETEGNQLTGAWLF
ncbi:MAG: phosphoribosyltransferase [Flavisolibacter sp.]|jgi:pyrimidine operon attenuation protein/uracil phosphoribosyltransferase|nr:phosphoribosyltransferase [Flavisolibacter sp.]